MKGHLNDELIVSLKKMHLKSPYFFLKWNSSTNGIMMMIMTSVKNSEKSSTSTFKQLWQQQCSSIHWGKGVKKACKVSRSQQVHTYQICSRTRQRHQRVSRKVVETTSQRNTHWQNLYVDTDVIISPSLYTQDGWSRLGHSLYQNVHGL